MTNLCIQHQCPQCGAPAELDETDRLFECAFCRVKSYLLPQLFFRYMLPHAAPADTKLIYYPYWRFKGMTFAASDAGITHRFVDASHQAVDSDRFPPSLGLRSQALTLHFADADTPGRFLKPQLPFKDVLTVFDQRFKAKTTGTEYHRAHIGENISLIYAPFYEKGGKVFDAVLNQPLTARASQPFDARALPGGRPAWRTRFIPNLCPQCGWDLEGQRDSLILFCKNCVSVWKPLADKLKPIRFGHFPAAAGPVLFLPFWRIQTDISGYTLASYADLVKLANLPKAPQPGWDQVPFRFWVPAFKVRPRTFINLVRNMTLSQPRTEPDHALPEGRLFPVTLPVKEAAESLKLALASFVKPPRNMLPRLPDAEVAPRRFLLVFIPFQEGHHDYTLPGKNIAINKNQLALSGNL
jgi:hypothetical protein